MMRRTPFDEMDRMFDQFRRSMWSGMADDFDRAGDFDANISLDRTDDGYVVLADLPGFEREEIDLRFDDGSDQGGVLTIDATHEVAENGHSRSRHIHERMTIPADVDVGAIEATYRNGVLEITLPAEFESEDGGHHIDID